MGSGDQSPASVSSPSHASFSPFSLPLHPFLHHLSFIFQHQYDQHTWLSLLLHPCPSSLPITSAHLQRSWSGCWVPGRLSPAFLAASGDCHGTGSCPSPACRQEEHSKKDRQGQQVLPHGPTLALGWERRPGGTGTEGLTVPGVVPSLGAHQLPCIAPTAGTESLPCWQLSSLAEEAAEKMQLQQTTATRASAAIHTWH